jgi:hypothetical protein
VPTTNKKKAIKATHNKPLRSSDGANVLNTVIFCCPHITRLMNFIPTLIRDCHTFNVPSIADDRNSPIAHGGVSVLGEIIFIEIV